MFRNLVLCLCCLFLAACAGREQSSAPPPADFVSTTLGHAAEQAHGDLAMIARLRGQGLQPLLLPSDPSLNLPVSITWTGPVEGALKEICLQLGYRLLGSLVDHQIGERYVGTLLGETQSNGLADAACGSRYQSHLSFQKFHCLICFCVFTSVLRDYHLRRATVALWPPKPSVFDMAIVRSALRAVLGV